MAYRKITTAEKLGRGPNKVADAAKRLRKKLGNVKVPDTVSWRELLEDKDFDFDKFLVWVKENVQQGGKITGVASLWLGEHLVRGFNKVFVDNKYVRELEQVAEYSAIDAENDINPKTGKKYGPSGLSKFVKNHPWVMGYFTYWTMLVASVAGAVGVAKTAMTDDRDAPKKEVKQDNKKESVVVSDVTDADKGKIQPVATETTHEKADQVAPTEIVVTSETRTVNPDEAQFVKQAINEYWPEIAIGLTELETYRAEPKRHGTEARSTNGLGCTYTYYYDKSGKLYRIANSINVKKVKTFDKAGNYEQCKRHLIYELLPGVQGAIKGKSNIGAQQTIAIAWAGYQRPADMAEIATRISKATTVQQVADAFAYYPGAKKWRDGTLKRRWWCAAYAIGLIDIKDFMELDRDAFSRININNVYRNGHFLLGKETVKYALARAKGNDRRVSSFLGDFKLGRELMATVNKKNGGNKLTLKVDEKTSQDKVIERSMALLNQAESAFAKGDYATAEKLYKQAIVEDADNMEAYSSLALTYKKLGDKNKSIAYYEKCVQTVKQGNARMNANKDLLLDRDVKAASYYNAGAAREEMANIYLARGNKAEARKNYDLAIKNYKTALENADMDDLGEKRKKVYQDAINRANKQLNAIADKGKNKKVAFDASIKQMHQKNAKADIFLYGREFKGNDLA